MRFRAVFLAMSLLSCAAPCSAPVHQFPPHAAQGVENARDTVLRRLDSLRTVTVRSVSRPANELLPDEIVVCRQHVGKNLVFVDCYHTDASFDERLDRQRTITVIDCDGPKAYAPNERTIRKKADLPALMLMDPFWFLVGWWPDSCTHPDACIVDKPLCIRKGGMFSATVVWDFDGDGNLRAEDGATGSICVFARDRGWAVRYRSVSRADMKLEAEVIDWYEAGGWAVPRRARSRIIVPGGRVTYEHEVVCDEIEIDAPRESPIPETWLPGTIEIDRTNASRTVQLAPGGHDLLDSMSDRIRPRRSCIDDAGVVFATVLAGCLAGWMMRERVARRAA